MAYVYLTLAVIGLLQLISINGTLAEIRNMLRDTKSQPQTTKAE